MEFPISLPLLFVVLFSWFLTKINSPITHTTRPQVTLTRRRKKFTAQQFTLRPAVYLGPDEGGDE